MKNNDTIFLHEMEDFDTQWKVMWEQNVRTWITIKPELETIINLVNTYDLEKWVQNIFFNRFRNYRIGWFDEEIFWQEINYIMYDQFFYLLQQFTAVKAINLDNIINDAMSNNESTTVSKHNNGNIQTTSWEDEDGNRFMVEETRDHEKTINGIRLSAIKNIINNSINMNPRKILQKFEPCFQSILERDWC